MSQGLSLLICIYNFTQISICRTTFDCLWPSQRWSFSPCAEELGRVGQNRLYPLQMAVKERNGIWKQKRGGWKTCLYAILEFKMMKHGIVVVKYTVLKRKRKSCSAIVDTFLRKRCLWWVSEVKKKNSRTIDKSKGHALTQTLWGHMVL